MSCAPPPVTWTVPVEVVRACANVDGRAVLDRINALGPTYAPHATIRLWPEGFSATIQYVAEPQRVALTAEVPLAAVTRENASATLTERAADPEVLNSVIQDLRDEVQRLSRLAGEERDDELTNRIMAAFRMSLQQARICACLYMGPPGAVRTHEMLEEAAPSMRGFERECDAAIKVWVGKVRKALGGPETVESCHGLGYRMTDEGRSRIFSKLGGAAF